MGTVAIPAGDKQAEGAYPRQMRLCSRVWKAGQPTYGSKLPGSESGLKPGNCVGKAQRQADWGAEYTEFLLRSDSGGGQ